MSGPYRTNSDNENETPLEAPWEVVSCESKIVESDRLQLNITCTSLLKKWFRKNRYSDEKEKDLDRRNEYRITIKQKFYDKQAGEHKYRSEKTITFDESELGEILKHLSTFENVKEMLKNIK